jgi:homoserine kinase type II
MLGDLRVVLDRYPAAVQPLAEPEDLGNAGGQSGANFWRYRAGVGVLLVRAWPHDGPPCAVLERVHGWLRDTAELGFVPVPIATRDGRTLTEQRGRWWELTPWLAGKPDPEQPPSRERVKAAFSSLAAFHACLSRYASPGPSNGLVARLKEVESLCQGGFAELGRALSTRPEDDQVVALAGKWLELAPSVASTVRVRLEQAASRVVDRQPCLRDARPDHFLFEGERVSGLVDFGAMGEDTVACDLARLSSEWLGDDRSLRGEGLNAYASTRPLVEAEMELIPVFEESSALLIGGHWIRWYFLEGRRFEDPIAVLKGVQKGLDRLAAWACPGGRLLA